MIFIMALIGALTRLTESGLSITDWNPILGAIPPLNKSDWNKAFAAYQQIPQYQILNRGMTLTAFRHIYFWEWLHRLWGRLIGIVFAVPLIYFSLRQEIGKKTGLKLLGILGLGGLQGFIGWFMVESGLAVRTEVSPYRLALHLSFALLIYALILWVALDLSALSRVMGTKSLRRHGWFALALLALTIIWGALVAGLRAGEVYNTWPLMEGEFLPGAAFTIEPHWLNIFANTALVQFIHRWLGPMTALVIFAWVLRLWRRDRSRWILALGIMAVLQVALGMTTLLTHVEIIVAVLHQAGAMTLLTLMVANLRRLKAGKV